MLTPLQIKDLRKDLALSADRFAGYIGLKGKHRARTVFGWEKGKLKPSKKNETKLEDVHRWLRQKKSVRHVP